MKNSEKEKKAIEYSKQYEKRNGRKVVDFQKAKKGFRGFDLLSYSKNGKDVRSIEVKGTEKNKKGDLHIPIVYDTGFTRDKKLIATHLYLVVLGKGKLPKLIIFKASEIKPEYVREERHFRITIPRETFRNKLEQKKPE